MPQFLQILHNIGVLNSIMNEAFERKQTDKKIFITENILLNNGFEQIFEDYGELNLKFYVKDISNKFFIKTKPRKILHL